jgi:hypothetical protein
VKKVLPLLALFAILALLGYIAGVRAGENESNTPAPPAKPTANPPPPQPVAPAPAAGADNAAATEKTDDAKPADGPVVKWKNMRAYTSARRIEIDGAFQITKGILELFLCTPRGKSHESLFMADIDGWELKVALYLIGLREGCKPVTVRGIRTVDGERVIIHARWKDKDGKVQTVRAEDLIYNIYTRKSMQRVGWVFTGSRMLKHPETNDRMLAVRACGNICVVWHDFDALLDTPLPEGADDTTFVAYTERTPEHLTPVTLIITPDDEHNKKWRKKAAEDKNSSGKDMDNRDYRTHE